ncbi:MAG: hypothetical protein E4G90_01940 [Gemmatimonadales bacterium]|nr:MAG: hypothetical protein E4G90_01940 [Gemmatimonadales bacterium]
MPYPIERKLVVAVASSALFDLTKSDRVYRTKGVDAYRRYQRKHEREALGKGDAFPFVLRLLGLRDIDKKDPPVEVVLLSRNDPDTGQRIFHSIQRRKLDISRAAFTNGRDQSRGGCRNDTRMGTGSGQAMPACHQVVA